MKKLIKQLLIVFAATATGSSAFSQNSVLVNFGGPTCSTSPPGFFLIKDPFAATSTVMTSCDLSKQLPDFYNVFVAYNPKNNKIYIADIRTGETQIWIMDVGLPGSVTCPATIPVTPDHTYSYVSNNFEFDNNGDLWSFSNYDLANGQCSIDKFDVNTGEVLNTRILQFPQDHFPTSITSGDLTILPNGRMFATLGSDKSQLYEITNYNNSGAATATWLKTLPENCFGIAYLNGMLEITGFNAFGCYYYKYDLSNATLSAGTSFQNGQAPIDNTSFSPALGTTKQLLTATYDNNNATVTYEIFVRNMGNTILNDINVTEDLQATFGAGKVSNVHAAFVNGANPAGLTLNGAYNGTTVTSLLSGGQQLPNSNSGNNDYFFKIRVSCTVSNPDKNKIYYNSAIGKAIINNAVDPIYVTDSSNNGNETMVDPNNDGNASGVNENIPTPFSLNSLPVKFLNVSAQLVSGTSAVVSWKVATPVTDAGYFEPEYSTDAVNFKTLDKVDITDIHQSSYHIRQNNLPAGRIYYRIKQTDADGSFVYSKIVLVETKNSTAAYQVFPNPAKESFSVIAAGNFNKANIVLFDAAGRQLRTIMMTGNIETVNTGNLPNGTYLLRITSSSETTTRKLVIKH